jgi:hypothetical protein
MMGARGARAAGLRLGRLATTAVRTTTAAALAAAFLGCAGPETFDEVCQNSPAAGESYGDGAPSPHGENVWVSADLGLDFLADVRAAARAWSEATGGRVTFEVHSMPLGDQTLRPGVTVFACPDGSAKLRTPDDGYRAGAVTTRDSARTTIAVRADRALAPAKGLMSHEFGHVLGLDDDRVDLTALMADGPRSVRPVPGPRDLALWSAVAEQR